MPYERYDPQEEVREALPLFSGAELHRFRPSMERLSLAAHLIHKAVTIGTGLFTEEGREAFLAKPCIHGVLDRKVLGVPVGGLAPIGENCVACYRCRREEEFCSVEINPLFAAWGDNYLHPDRASKYPTFFYLWGEAATGQIPVRGMSYAGPFAGEGWDGILFDMSEIVRPTRDGVHGREYISTAVDLGRKLRLIRIGPDGEILGASRVTESPLPFLFDYLPPHLTSKYIHAAVRHAAKRVHGLFIERPEYVPSADESSTDGWRANYVPLVSAREWQEHEQVLARAPMIEFEYNDADTPRGDVAVAFKRLQRINPAAPLFARTQALPGLEERVLRLVDQGVDGVHLCFDYHSHEISREGWAPDVIARVHETLVHRGLRDEVSLIASGGIIMAEHVPKAIIMGADAVGIDTAMLVALDAQPLGECRVPEESRFKLYKIPTDWGSQRLVNLSAAWYAQIIEVLSAMGLRDIRRLRGERGRAMRFEDLEREFVETLKKGGARVAEETASVAVGR